MTVYKDDMSALRSENIEKNKQRLLGAARTIILQEGIDALSVRKLANGSNLALKTIYNLYGNKENVIIAVFEQGTRGIEQAITELEASMCQGPWKTDYYITWIRAIEQVFLGNKDLLKPALLASETLNRLGSGSASAMHLRRIQKFRNTLQMAADRGLIWEDLDLGVMAHLLYRNYFGVALQWAQGELDDRALKVHGRYTVLSILHTLINEPSRQQRTLALMRALKD